MIISSLHAYVSSSTCNRMTYFLFALFQIYFPQLEYLITCLVYEWKFHPPTYQTEDISTTSLKLWLCCLRYIQFKETLHPIHMRQPVVAVGTKHCHPVNAVDTKGCCCNICFGCFHRLVNPQHRISKGVADYLSEVSQSSKAEWWIYIGLWQFWPWPWKSNQIQHKGALLPPWINFNPSMDK